MGFRFVYKSMTLNDLERSKRIYTMSQKKTCELSFHSVLVKSEPISIKINRYVLVETFNKTVHFTQTLTLSRQRNTYMYILMNHWRTTKRLAVIFLENRQTCSKSHHPYIICSKCISPTPTQARRRWHRVANRAFNEQRDSDFTDMCDLSTRWRRTFRTCSVKMMWRTTRLTIFETMIASCICGYSMIH